MARVHHFTATVSIVKKLLVLESERGPLSGFEPAISEVVDSLNTVSHMSNKENFRDMGFSLYMIVYLCI